MATAVKNARTLVTSSTNTAGSTTRGTLSLGTALGGVLTAKVTNGATGPTVGCTVNILVAHNGTAPTAASAGTDWKTVYTYTAGTTNSAVYEVPPYVFGPEVMSIEVEFTGNTAQSVTVESFVSEVTSFA